jgi:hypothetical protein
MSETKRIDLTRYKGHTKGDNEVGWRINNNFVSNDKCPNDRYIAYVKAFSVVDFDLEDKVIEFSDADANLIADAPLFVAELKKMYAREDELLDALRIIRDDLQEARAYGAYTLAQSEKLQKICNFANDASQ